jgi:hypothetical protein
MKSELEDFISNNREAFDNRVPDPAVLERLQQQLKASAPKKEKAVVIPIKMLKWAAAACVVLIGGAIFWVSQKETPATQIASTPIEKTPTVVPQTNTTPESTTTVIRDIPVQQAAKRDNSSAIEEENNLRKTMLFAKLNNMESPSQRLTAASQVYQIKDGDTDIVDALVKTMNSDPSTNVRLAALDALSKFYREAYVKKKLLSSLNKQTDPMVQIGLIELLTKMKERSILKQLDKIVNDGNTMQAVKDQAYTSIFTLRS